MISGDPRKHVVEIEWITSAACNKDSSDAPKMETKCYHIHSYHDNGLKASFVDLSGLIRDSGYTATKTGRPDLVLNISACRPVKSSDGCNGAMACLYNGDSQLHESSNKLSLSKLSSGNLMKATPHMEGNFLTAEYPISSLVAKDCDGTSFVRIRFICPTAEQVKWTCYQLWLLIVAAVILRILNECR